MTGFTSALVTGATGFIGSALTRRLAEEGVKTYCLVREGRYNPAEFETLQGVEVIEIRSSQTDALRTALAGITADVVFDLASYGVNPKENDPEIMIETNLRFLSSLLLITSQWPLRRFIHAGSCFEYGESPDRMPIREDHPLQPISLYGAAKAASVLYGNALAAKLAIPFVTLRLFGVYGIGERPHRLVPYIINRLSCNEPVDLTPGQQVRDLLYIDDVVEAFTAAARQDRVESLCVYNVCSGTPVTIREVGETVAKSMDKPSTLLHWGERAYSIDEPMWIAGDGSKFEKTTGWRPNVSLLEGIKRMIHEHEERNVEKGRYSRV
jgi:UDP-glucose 4-epimerase